MAPKQIRNSNLHMVAVVLCSICALMLFAACQGVSSSGSQKSVSGKITAINPATHSVTIALQGTTNGQPQTITINDFTDQQITALQGHLNSSYTFQVIPTNGTYTIVSNSTPVSQTASTGQTTSTGTPGQSTTPTPQAANSPQTASVPGNIAFIGKVQSFTSNSLTVSMPDGSTLTMNITSDTDQHRVNGIPSPGTDLEISATSNSDGSFQADELRSTYDDSNDDLNTVSFVGVTTSTVGSDNILHFQVGTKTFSALIDHKTDFHHLDSASDITSDQAIKVDVLFDGSTGNALDIEPWEN